MTPVRGQPGDASLPGHDLGLQPERTALAWQRTALSMAGASLIVARLTVGAVGPVAGAVLVFCIGHAAVLFRHSRRRYDARTGASVVQPRSVGLHGALLALQVVLLAGLEVASLVTNPPA